MEHEKKSAKAIIFQPTCCRNVIKFFLFLFQLSAAKREAFFKGAELPAPTPKFDPNARFTSDRPERARDQPVREPVRNMEYDKEKERDKKYGDSTKELDGYVGFANLPNQVYRKSVKRGFDFTLMVVGRYCLKAFVSKAKL